MIATTATKFAHLTSEYLRSCGKKRREKKEEERRRKRKEEGRKKKEEKRREGEEGEKRRIKPSHIATLALPKPKTTVCGIAFGLHLCLSPQQRGYKEEKPQVASDALPRMQGHLRA